MPEEPIPEPPWRGRPLRFTVEVREHDGGMRAHVAWADDADDILATCDAGMPADALAGATAALTSIVGRIEVEEGLRRGIHAIADAPPTDPESAQVSPLIRRLAAEHGIDPDDEREEPPTPGASPPA